MLQTYLSKELIVLYSKIKHHLVSICLTVEVFKGVNANVKVNLK